MYPGNKNPRIMFGYKILIKYVSRTIVSNENKQAKKKSFKHRSHRDKIYNNLKIS